MSAPWSRGVFVALVLSASSLAGVAVAAEDWGAPPPQSVDPEAPSRAPASLPPRLPVPGREPVPEQTRRTAIYGIFGLGTPVGVYGLEAVHRFGGVFELAAGVGLGSSAMSSESSWSLGHVLQWSVMPRVHLGNNDYNAFTLGAGISGGQYGGLQLCIACDDEGGSTSGYPTRYALWGNFELGGEHWTRRGFAIRYFFGVASGETLAPRSGSINGETLVIPYTGFGMGYAF